MKQKLKYVVPLLLILVLAWGLLEVAEKAALLISIALLTSYLLYQFREDKKLRRAMLRGELAGEHAVTGQSQSPLLQIEPVEEPFDAQARHALTNLLRISLKINKGRFKQDIEEANRLADELVEALETEELAPQDCPELVGQLEELGSKIRRYVNLQEQAKRNPGGELDVHELQGEIRGIIKKLGDHRVK